MSLTIIYKKTKIIIIAIIADAITNISLVGAYILYFPTVHLPSQPVALKALNGTVSYFDIYLYDVPDGYDVTNGYYVGWCADRSVQMPRNTNLTVRLYNTYDLLLPMPFRSRNWSKVNYILNNKGDAPKTDVQDAFWYLLCEYPYKKLTSTGKMLVDNADVNFIPKQGDFIAVLAEPVYADGRPWPFQFCFIQMRLCLEGKSHGFWKNHLEAWPDGYTSTMHVVDVFENASHYVLTTDTLLDALNYKGGNDLVGAALILLRNAVASVLNARHSCINYPIPEADLIEEINEALGSNNRTTMLNLEAILDNYNNLNADLSK